MTFASLVGIRVQPVFHPKPSLWSLIKAPVSPTYGPLSLFAPHIDLPLAIFLRAAAKYE